jgi:hypothetical protein
MSLEFQPKSIVFKPFAGYPPRFADECDREWKRLYGEAESITIHPSGVITPNASATRLNKLSKDK